MSPVIAMEEWPRRSATGAYAVMALDSGGAGRELDAAGRRHDDYLNAERRGVAGFGHRFTQKG